MKTNSKIAALWRGAATVVVMAAICQDAATVQAQITDVNVGSAPDATDGDTIRNAFIKCNTDFNWIGGQLDGIATMLAGLSTTYDPYGLALSVGLYGTNYTLYAVGTNTVAWLGLLNSCSNVLQGGVTALTNNVNSLWSALSGSSALHPGGQMAFDQMTAWPYAMQITSDGSGNVTVGGSLTANGLLNAYYLGDSYNSTPAAGYVATSQSTDGTWQWQAPPSFPTTLNFDSGNITSDGSGDASFVSLYAQQLKDSSGGTGGAGDYAQANGAGGWSWTAWPTTLNYDAGDITSDGAGNIAATGFRGSLLDNGNSSGASGYVPTANGDGSWTWAEGGGSFPDLTDSDGNVGVNQTSPSYNLDVNGSVGDSQGGWNVQTSGQVSFDNGAFASDGSGDVTCTSLNQFSDVTTKTNIAPYAPANLLASLPPVYTWRFKDRTVVRTNAHYVVTYGTNWISRTNRLGQVTNQPVLAVVSSNLVTAVKTNLLAGQRHIGPMAQDWNASFGLGGGTNVINSTDLQGILLEAVRQLASPGSAVLTNAAGARFTVMVNAATNGLVFVPQ